MPADIGDDGDGDGDDDEDDDDILLCSHGMLRHGKRG